MMAGHSRISTACAMVSRRAVRERESTRWSDIRLFPHPQRICPLMSSPLTVTSPLAVPRGDDLKVNTSPATLPWIGKGYARDRKDVAWAQEDCESSDLRPVLLQI